jgi:hypothetical protein
MQIPDDVYATLAAVVEKFPHTGDDEARRAAMEKAVATLRARHGLRWVWKTEHASLIAPSKDGLGYVPDGEVVHGRLTTMLIWDTINGGTRRLNAAPLVSEAPRKAYVLAVPPKDWLAGDLPTPTPTPPAPPSGTAEILKRIGEVERDLKALQDKVSDAALDALIARRVNARIVALRLVGDPNLPDEQAVSTNSVWGHAHRFKARIE